MGNLSTEIQRDGTSQIRRLAEALLPDYAQVDDRSIEDYLELFYKLAQQFVYKNEKNIVSGNWQEFFVDFADREQVENTLLSLRDAGNTTSHITVVIAFLKMLESAVGDLNQLTKKHLDFFYSDVLRIKRNGAEADLVHVIFELEKNTKAYKLDEGTLLDAGKDANKNPKQYKLQKEIVLNQSKIEGLKSVFVDKSRRDKIFAAPIANSSDGMGGPFATENKAWNAFGELQNNKSDEQLTMQEANVGFAVASPVLLLSEGERLISLEISGRNQQLYDSAKTIKDNFKVYISGEKEWITCEVISATSAQSGTTESIDGVVIYYETNLSLLVKMSVEDAAAVAFNPEIYTEGYVTPWPVLKLELDHNAKQYGYELLKSFEAKSISINVDVKNQTTLNLQNELGVLDSTKPFMPFGATPRPASSLTIGSTELSTKKVDEVQLTLRWDNLPATSLGDHYLEYADNVINSSFIVQPYIFKAGKWEATETTQNLFASVDATQDNLITLTGFSEELTKILKSSSKKDNHIRLELLPLVTSSGAIIEDMRAFGHQEFTNLYTDAAMKKAQATTVAEVEGISYPNSPYTPVIKELQWSYLASDNISLDELQPTGQFFKNTAFGYEEIKSPSGPFNLLPQYDAEGNFYIGIKGTVPPQNVSILFQVAEGSGVVSSESEVDDIQWSYLSDKGWQSLNSTEILTETTLNLQKSGIIEFAIGSDAIQGSTRFIDSPELYWIRGAVDEESRQICKVIELHTNAAIAEYIIDECEDIEIQPLPAGTITKLVNKKASVKKIQQPYSSFGGRSSEIDETYYTRVSELIRHKNRQTTLWDYERAILQQFPEVYKVKCLKHADAESNVAPGNVTLLIISNLRNQNASRPLEPTTSYGTLVEIGNYASRFVSPFTKINVENPTYEKLLVDFKVGFHEGIDGGYYASILNEEIKRFLSPWAYEEGKDIIFGGKVYRSDILWFVENREYVDYVTEFKLYHIYDSPSNTGIDCMQIENDFIVRDYQGLQIGDMAIGSTFIVGYESEIAEATSPRSILVSEEDHRIEVLKPGEYSCRGNTYDGIGQMAIEINFDIE